MEMQNEMKAIFHKINTIMDGPDGLSQLEKDLIKSYLEKASALLDEHEQDQNDTPESNHVSEVKVIAENHVPEPAPAKAPKEDSPSAGTQLQRDNTLVDMLQQSPVGAEFDAIFAVDHGSELSERLAMTPLRNLGKAITINDRLLYTNELFEGDSDVFAETVDVIDGKSSLEDAQSFLARHIIRKYDWMEESRLDRARDFVKLINRRFNA